jgi:hypothetical protein
MSPGILAVRDRGGYYVTSSRIRSRTASALERSLHHASSDGASWCYTLDQALTLYANAASDHLWDDITDVIRHGMTSDTRENVGQWMSRKCDTAMWRRFVKLAPYPSCQAGGRPSLIHSPACAGLRTCAQRHGRNATYTPHIAIIVGATTRKVVAPSTKNMALFTLSLPSIAKTVECGFRYTVFLGYDAGDAFFDSPTGVETLRAWFQANVRRPLLERGIDIDVTPVRVKNASSKPGPVFNAVALQAQSAAVDFFYRINDDTLMLTPWAGAYACSLCSLGPPYGVVGPVESVRVDILTHDFVHAMHLDIFHEYYPGFLTDWWLDDWISKVYGPARSYRLAEVKVREV